MDFSFEVKITQILSMQLNKRTNLLFLLLNSEKNSYKHKCSKKQIIFGPYSITLKKCY